MTGDLASKYTPANVEPQVNLQWRQAKAFHADPVTPGRPYAIVIPPPNVTSALHIGHALNNTLQDILIRWRRMQGHNTLWMPGTDHAGIATQTVVEKRIRQEEGRKRTDFDRDEFLARIQAWKDEYEGRITDQLKAMGCSCDWDRQRFTMDPVCTKAVREAFYRLFRDGLIYRGKRLVNWDPATQTALADDEVQMKEVTGSFWYLKYPVVDNEHEADPLHMTYVTVATTRPETMMGDTAVAVNPNDPRAAGLIGKHVRLPIVNRLIPIIADEYVVLPNPDSSDEKAKYSSGFLKITPAHDPNDWEVGQRHGLDVINVLAPDGSISKDHGWPAEEFRTGQAKDAEPLLGLNRQEACQAVVAWFEQEGLLEQVRPYRHMVGHSYRSHVPIEPYLSDQWYVKVTDKRLAGAALRAMATSPPTSNAMAPPPHSERAKGTPESQKWQGSLRFYPARYARTYQLWHEQIRDWCISRQLWWGHRIPVWRAKPALPIRHEFPDFSNNPCEYELMLQAKLDALWRVRGDSSECIAKLDRVDGQPIVYICARGENDDECLGFLSDLMRNSPSGQQQPSGQDVNLETQAVLAMLQPDQMLQDPDVLDTWFSSALWPMSTMGWPEEEHNEVLNKWNPSDTLCTAREIITLWVSRMVMFNLYFRECLPFKDVFIHAMIQDGHGQKMSKSLGNGVDPEDIIHSHGSDAMRFTLTSMTTQTQDVRMPVDIVCPFTGQAFSPKFVNDNAGHSVAAPIQSCPTDNNRKMASSYGIATGSVKPDANLPLARNTSEKFDFGRNFANKLWNAARFALVNIPADAPATESQKDLASKSLVDRWILSRLAVTVRQSGIRLEAYEFKHYADGLYDFIWRDFCDWYIEAIKPTVRSNFSQQMLLANVLDVILRLLHPVMPYITEELWRHLNELVPHRAIDGAGAPTTGLLACAAWPSISNSFHDAEAQTTFEHIQRLVGVIREVRTSYQVPPRQVLACSVKASGELSVRLTPHVLLIQTLANASTMEIGSDVTRPGDAAMSLVADLEVYVHGLVDHDEQHRRLRKRLIELNRNIEALTRRLNNKGYVDRAPPHLVQQTREQLDAAETEAKALEAQSASRA